MRETLGTYTSRITHERRTRTCIIAVLVALALVVAAGVSWQLHYTGIAAANETFCGIEEHTHTDECYSQVLVCGSDESADHTHTDACYETELTCTIPEHIHTVECLIDPNAVDTSHVDWEATLPQLSGIWADDVVAIAQSQLGYTESPADVILDDTGELKGYTCYGDWYGSTHAENDTYANWDATFASFCLNYAGIPESDFPEGSGVDRWIKTLDKADLYVEEAQVTPGDLVFLDSDKDNVADTVAIIVAEKDGELTLIQGDSNNAVERNTLRADDESVVGFAVLPEQPEQDEGTVNEDVEDATENAATQEEIAQTVDDSAIGEDGKTAAVATNPAGEGLVMLDTDDDIQTLSEGNGDKLDGDYAYLTNVGMDKGNNDNSYAMTTGMEPFDKNDDAGNDSSATNDILRTFDTATYTVDMTTNVRSDAPYGTYTSGDLYFEFVVAGTSDEIEWETGAMGWLESKNGVFNITEEEFNGISYQVLRGYVTLAPGTDEGHAIGNTTQTLNLVLRVLAMQNGVDVRPDFTFFLAYNNVGLTDEQYDAWGTSSYDGPIVTFDGQDCEEHEEQEWQTIIAPDMTVSAVPRYNLAIVNSTASKTQQMGSYDFSTGNNLALDKDAGTKYGRLGGYGLVLQVVGKSASEGLRGVQLPSGNETLSISFNMSLSSTYTVGGSTVYQTGEESHGVDLTKYAPLIWSFDQNASGSSQQDNRTIPTSLKYADQVPYNKYSSNYWYCSCEDGGSWTIAANNDGTYTVTVTSCDVDMQQLPYVYPGASTSLSYNYYNPNNINYDPSDPTKNNYWEVQTACISAGELWVVQPYYAGAKDDGDTYIAQMLGEGTYSVTASDTVLEINQGDTTILPGSSGTSNQAITTDDSVGQSMALVNPGSIDQHIAYVKYDYAAWNDPLTDGCFSNGKDWILQGDKLTIEGYLTHDQAEEGNTGVAYDELFKFDDVFFEPNGTVNFNGLLNSETRTYLWAAKSDGTGWDHGGKKPDESGYDTEMINATPDDLIYYSSLSTLQSDGKTCVGVLVQYRGLMTEQQNHIHTYIKGTSKMTADTDQVYMVTPYARTWTRNNLAAAMAADPDSGYYGNESQALSDLLSMELDDVKTWVNKYIPTKTGNGSNSYFYEDNNGDILDYPDCYWKNGDWRHPTTATGGSSRTPNILNYQKTYYDANGCHEGTSGNYYGDSCLLVGYKSGLAMSVAQPTTSGDGSTHNKSVFDMDTGQTVVDYVVNPFITRNNGEQSYGTVTTTEVVVTITLPENLTYIEGSSYIGGTYETNGEGKQGTVTGGTNLSSANNNTATFTYTVNGVDYDVTVHLTVTTNSDGTQTLTYTFTDVPVTGTEIIQYLENIYYSCEISSGAVKNGDELDVTADIYCSSDQGIDPTARDDGEAIVGITVSKNTAVSLVKQADQTAVEVNGEIGFTMDVGDNSDNPMAMVAVDNIPYNGDGSSYFKNKDTCQVYVTEFSAYDITATRNLDGFYFFYTTDEAYADKTSADYPEGEYFVLDLGESGEAVNQQCLDDGWKQITMDNTEHDTADHTIYKANNIPDNTNIYSIVAVGMIEGSDDINLHVTLKLSDPEPGDYVINNLSQQHSSTITDESGQTVTTYSDLADNARSNVVGRTISGVVWLDEDVDGGIRTGTYGNEQLLGGVTVTLQVKDSSGNWVKAEKLKYTDDGDKYCVTTTDAEGYYEFDYLPAGTYRVVFSGVGVGDGSNLTYDLSDHDVTIYEATDIDDSVNSKVVRNSGTDTIDVGVLPEATAITGSIYEVPYQNAGYTKMDSFKVDKIWKDVNGNDITGSTTMGSVTAQVTVTGSGNVPIRDEEVTLDSGNGWKSTLDDLPYYDGNGKEFDYTVTDFTVNEITGNDGYNVTIGDIIDNGDGTYSVSITNQANRELPNTGGAGTTIFTLIGLALVGGAGATLIYRRRRGSSAKEVMP